VSALQSLKWINRHGTSCASLTLLLLFSFAAHTVAVSRITLFDGIPLATLPPRLLRNIAGIHLFQLNWWFGLPYLLLFIGLLLYMEFRSTPRWTVWATFAFMSLPIIAYSLTCVRVVTVPIFIT
jgi:hypothetical protein